MVRPTQVVAALKRVGYVAKRQKGSHLVLWHESKRRTTIVALHGRDLPMPTLKKILQQTGLTDDEFLELL
jgi:predicted RNA binding protein YcfA (HicA-like mRNA interferase family)